MKVKDKLDAMAHNIAEALQAFHERLERIEKWMLLQENKNGEEVKQDACRGQC